MPPEMAVDLIGEQHVLDLGAGAADLFRGVFLELRQFLFEDLRRRAAPLQQMIAIADNADTGDALLERNVPEPATVGNVGDGRGAFVETLVAQRALVVGPDRDALEPVVGRPPTVARDRRRARAASSPLVLRVSAQ